MAVLDVCWLWVGLLNTDILKVLAIRAALKLWSVLRQHQRRVPTSKLHLVLLVLVLSYFLVMLPNDLIRLMHLRRSKHRRFPLHRDLL